MKRKIFVVDDHPIMRKGCHFLIDQEPDLRVCGEASSALEALEKIGQERPDLVIVDISLGGMGGLELIKHLQAREPDLAVLVVSAHDESLYGERALMAGARGYIMKVEVDTTAVEAMRRILRGGFYLSDQMGTKILLQYQKMGGLPAEEEAPPIRRLSDRELEIFELTGQGYSPQQIAEALLLSPKTIETHRRHIREKLAIETTTELLRRATLWVERQP